MTDIELAIFTVLWAVLVALAALVLLLYRQIEKAYSQDAETRGAALPAGATAPEFEILTKDGPVVFQYPDAGQPTLLAFLTTECDACATLLSSLESDDLGAVQRYALFSGEQRQRDEHVSRNGVQRSWVAHAPDIVHSFGVTSTPTVFLLNGRDVLASQVAATPAAVREMVKEFAPPTLVLS